MVSARAAKELINRKKVLFFAVSFFSFWIAISLQSNIKSFLADKISQEILNFATVLAMWTLAIYIFPLIGAIVLVIILIKTGNLR